MSPNESIEKLCCWGKGDLLGRRVDTQHDKESFFTLLQRRGQKENFEDEFIAM